MARALAQACKAAGDIEGARNHYGVVTKLDPDFVAGWDAWSRLELREGNPCQSRSTRQERFISCRRSRCRNATPTKSKDCGTPTLGAGGGRRRC